MKSSKYSDIDSPYIRERLANTRFEERGVIDDLIRLREGILHPPRGRRLPSGILGWMAEILLPATGGVFEAWGLSILRKKYPDEHMILLREHSEKAFQIEMERRQRAEQEAAVAQEEHRAREMAEKQAELDDWVRAGGIPPASDPRR